MKLAITGATGFVGSHLTRKLVADGHEVVLISRGINKHHQDLFTLPTVTKASIGLSSSDDLTNAFTGCHAVAHLAGINREIKSQTYEEVHVASTSRVVEAAKRAGVKQILLLSFLRARPGSGSSYHESKWKAEEIVRRSGIPFTVVKAGVIYGKGDHMITHTCQALRSFPLFGLMGFRPTNMSPVAVSDVVRILTSILVEDKLANQTVAVVGPEALTLKTVVKNIGGAIGVKPIFIPLPLMLHYAVAMVCETFMNEPIVARAQVRMLSENLTEGVQPINKLPADMEPKLQFTVERVREALAT